MTTMQEVPAWLEDSTAPVPQIPEPSFEHGLEQTVLPAPGLVLLDPDARDGYQDRLADARGSVSELYQVNSRWRRGALQRLPSENDQQALRRWFLSSRRSFDTSAMSDAPAADRPVVGMDRLPGRLAGALGRLARDGFEGGLLYPADVCAAFDGWVHLLPPNADHLVRERRFDQPCFEAIKNAVVPSGREAVGKADLLIFVSVVPWRLEVTHGPRGYRNALLETGVLIARASALFAGAGLGVDAIVDFVDTTVDAVLDQDGVERFCAAVIAVRLDPEAPLDQQARLDQQAPLDPEARLDQQAPEDPK